ncbi:MAG: DUF4157 domain-containing protein [Limnohabitans sp.]|nr:DUF4157 domain-containing protein [Limnohabitans sp.]
MFNQKSKSNPANTSSSNSGKSEDFFGVQAKLNIGKSNDKYEVEADKMVDKVVASPQTNNAETFFSPSQRIQKKQNAEIQKKDENDTQSETSINPDFESKLNSSKGSGASLPKTTQGEMESGFGSDFSNVKIHTDSNAIQMNQQLGSQAFANGNDIYFNEGKYNPNSQNGKHLLAHELTHTVQQTGSVQKKDTPDIQRSWLGDAWDSVTSAAGDAIDWVGDTASSIGSGISSAWSTATTFLGDAASSLWSGMQSLGSDVLSWLSSAGSAVWSAISWFGSLAWDIISTIGIFLWEKLVMLGTNVWSFISNIPSRLWRIVVHGWHAITGILGWAWNGLTGALGHIWQGLVGVFGWLGDGLSGLISWLGTGLANGFAWAIDFIMDPSLSKIWDGLLGTLSWVWSGITGFAQWGWNGIVGAVMWAWQGIKGFASWIWDAIIGTLEWAGRLLLYVLDLIGLLEALQILWGLIFRMRPLRSDEISASLQVHPAGMIPYDLVWVDEGSLVAYISGYFSGGGYRAVTTAHVLHVAPGEDLATMVHELSHVAQYEHAGSVYMAEAIHAQAFGEGYSYRNTDGTFKHAHFNEFNREQQASICEDYYRSVSGTGGGNASSTELQPFIDEMRRGQF